MNVTKEVITPKKATDWFKRNVNNRPLREPHCQRLADAIKAGEWHLNGETIKFNCNGDLIDGQHRLKAVILTGTPIESYIIRGLKHDAFHTIDVGAPRMVRDALARIGEKYYSHLATAIRHAFYLVNGTTAFGGGKPIRNTQAVDFLEKHQSIRESVEFAATSGIQTIMSVGLMAALHYLMGLKAKAKADEFWTSVADGEGLKKGMPAYELRKRLIAHRTGSNRLNRSEIPAFSIKAWNSFMAGEEISFLRWTDAEQLPEIKGPRRK